MPKTLLNEAELLLLKQWDQARLLERSMKGVRDKYSNLFDEVITSTTELYPSLDSQKQRVTQKWASGFVRLSSSKWYDGKDTWSAGLWFSEIRLERLADDGDAPPSVTVWIPLKIIKKMNKSSDAVLDTLAEAAKKTYDQEFGKSVRSELDNGAAITFPSPTKQEIIGLFADGDEEAFVKSIVGYFDLPARLIPALDELLTK